MNGRKHDFPYVGAIVESKDAFYLVKRHMFHDLKHVFVKCSTNVLEIRKDEGLVDVEAWNQKGKINFNSNEASFKLLHTQGNDVFGIFHC